MKDTNQHINKTTWITTMVFGILLALSGIQHGIFEILQGNKITETFIIQSIGPNQQRWMNGEEVFTLLHTFFITGIAAIVVSSIIIIWSLAFLRKSYGSAIFLLLFILLTFVGGGITHILFFLPVWLFSQRITREQSWRGAVGSKKRCKLLAKAWPYLLVFNSLLFLTALQFSFFGIPGASYEIISAVTYGSMLLSVVMLHLTFLAALFKDIRILEFKAASPTF